MSKYRGPRLRVVRRVGKLFAFTRKIPKRSVRSQGRSKTRRKPTQFSYRLIEKQKLRLYYCISEKQLISYVGRARKSKGSTGQILVHRLEIRLDRTVYRLCWAPTIFAARQMITHGHILVGCLGNLSRVNLPRFQVQGLEYSPRYHKIAVKGKIVAHIFTSIYRVMEERYTRYRQISTRVGWKRARFPKWCKVCNIIITLLPIRWNSSGTQRANCPSRRSYDLRTTLGKNTGENSYRVCDSHHFVGLCGWPCEEFDRTRIFLSVNELLVIEYYSNRLLFYYCYVCNTSTVYFCTPCWTRFSKN